MSIFLNFKKSKKLVAHIYLDGNPVRSLRNSFGSHNIMFSSSDNHALFFLLFFITWLNLGPQITITYRNNFVFITNNAIWNVWFLMKYYCYRKCHLEALSLLYLDMFLPHQLSFFCSLKLTRAGHENQHFLALWSYCRFVKSKMATRTENQLQYSYMGRFNLVGATKWCPFSLFGFDIYLESTTPKFLLMGQLQIHMPPPINREFRSLYFIMGAFKISMWKKP